MFYRLKIVSFLGAKNRPEHVGVFGDNRGTSKDVGDHSTKRLAQQLENGMINDVCVQKMRF